MKFFESAPKRASRPFRTVVILGSPGCGKTSLADQWIAEWQTERAGRGVLAVLDPAAQFAAQGGVWPGRVDPNDDRSPEERAEQWLKALKRTRVGKDDAPPCLVVLDDADTYLSGGQPRGVWRDFFMTFRHWRCDVIVIARRPQELPKAIFQNASVCALFLSTEPYSAEYLRAWVGPKATAQIPQTEHKALIVDVRSKETHEIATRQRTVLVAADRA